MNAFKNRKKVVTTATTAMLGVAFIALSSLSASAQVPVLYRVTGVSGTNNVGSPVPNPNLPPITMPAPAVAMVQANGGPLPTIEFGAGDFTYNEQILITNPPTAFGIFFSEQRWNMTNSAGTFAPGQTGSLSPAPGSFPATTDGGPFSTSDSVPPLANIMGSAGSSQYGGAFDLNLFFNSLNVFGLPAGFIAGSAPNEMLVGQDAVPAYDTTVHDFHPTGPPSPTAPPMFSSVVCPTDPSSCPWAGSITPVQIAATGIRWTTGNVTATHTNPPLPGLPPTAMLMASADPHSLTSMGSNGSLQLVSAFTTSSRGAFEQTAVLTWTLDLTFLPEPGPTAMLGAGILGLFVAYRGRQLRP